MTVLIATANQHIIQECHKSVKFTPKTANTCTFKVTELTFERIYSELKLKGYNPFAVMAW